MNEDMEADCYTSLSLGGRFRCIDCDEVRWRPSWDGRCADCHAEHKASAWRCPACRQTVHGLSWGGRCLPCHESATGLYDCDQAPHDYDPLDAGEGWD